MNGMMGMFGEMPDPTEIQMPEFPDDFPMIRPSYTKDPLFGGGLFNNKDSVFDLVNYYTARSPVSLQGFYVQMAAAILSGRTAKSITGGTVGDHLSYEVDVPDSGISAAIFYALSADGVDSNNLIGPDPDNPDGEVQYKTELLSQDVTGWDKSRRFHNSWYADGEINRFLTLTVLKPEAGKWKFQVRGKDGENQSLYAFVVLVSGVDVNISFLQGANGNGTPSNDASGNLFIRFENEDGNLSENFYKNVQTQCSILMMPSGMPIMTPEQMESLQPGDMSWMFSMPQIDWSNPAPMRGGSIEFTPRFDEHGEWVLHGRYDAPYPGNYMVELEMIFDKLDYSQSFYVSYEPKTGKSQTIKNIGQTTTIQAPFLDGVWGEMEKSGDLKLSIVENSWDSNPPGLVDFSMVKESESALVLTGLQKKSGSVSFKVKSDAGERWTITCPVSVG